MNTRGMATKILVTGAGSGGGENLVSSLRKASLNLCIYGSNADNYMLAKSASDRAIWLPSAKEESYTDALCRVLDKEKIELVIPNNDTEVGRISRDRGRIPCRVFLPPEETVEVCQDKLKMHQRFDQDKIPQAKSTEINRYEDIAEFMKNIDGDKYWIRPRRGSGSMGATWVQNYAQAKAWITLWVEMRNFRVNDFIVSEYLPGKDYAFQSVWKGGKLMVAKLVERLIYFMGRNRLSNMSSSPAVARTIHDEEALNTVFRAIYAVTDEPHGNFCLDLKQDVNGRMCVTEFNVGRFCMITPIFDNTGRYNTAEVYVRSALDFPLEVTDPIDIEEDVYLIRDLDTLPTVLRGDDFRLRRERAKAFTS